MAETIDEFFAEGDFDHYNAGEQAKAIHSLTKGDASVAATAQKLLTLYEAPDAATFSTLTTSVILPLAEERIESHEPLLALLKELKSAIDNGKLKLKANDNISLNYELWERMLRYGDPEPSSNLRDQYRQDWCNDNHFAAMVYAAGVDDLAEFGTKALQITLKKGQWRVNWEGPDNTSDKVEALQGHIDAGAQWILLAGKRLYTESEEVRKQWAEWEHALAWIVEQDLYDESKKLARDALAEMKKIKG